MANLTIAPADVNPVDVREQFTVPAAVAMTEGVLVYVDSNGKAALGSAGASGTSTVPTLRGVTIQKATAANETVTVVRKGLVGVGDALGGMAYGALVYLSDTAGGILADDAGSNSVVVGHVAPAWGATTPDKVLRVDL